MKRPSLRDDGRTVELDVHGATVRDALMLLRQTLMLSESRGRATVKVIHGYSTSVGPAQLNTIRSELHRLLDEGALSEVRSDYRFAGMTTLALDHGQRSDRRRITMHDLTSGR